jgi:hypothetical protein
VSSVTTPVQNVVCSALAVDAMLNIVAARTAALIKNPLTIVLLVSVPTRDGFQNALTPRGIQRSRRTAVRRRAAMHVAFRLAQRRDETRRSIDAGYGRTTRNRGLIGTRAIHRIG